MCVCRTVWLSLRPYSLQIITANNPPTNRSRLQRMIDFACGRRFFAHTIATITFAAVVAAAGAAAAVVAGATGTRRHEQLVRSAVASHVSHHCSIYHRLLCVCHTTAAAARNRAAAAAKSAAGAATVQAAADIAATTGCTSTGAAAAHNAANAVDVTFASFAPSATVGVKGATIVVGRVDRTAGQTQRQQQRIIELGRQIEQFFAHPQGLNDQQE